MPTLTPAKPVMGRYMDIRTDYGFKAVFGSEPNKDILIAFLNDLFGGSKRVCDIQYRPTEELDEDRDGRRIVYDLRCKGENGEEFVVELQRIRQTYFKDRMVFYFSRLISRLHRKGRKSNKYKLPEVYVVVIVDFRIEDQVCDRYCRTIALADIESGEVFYNKLFLKWLELPNFEKTGLEIGTNLDKWMWLFKNLGAADKIPLFMDTRALRKVFKITEVANLKEEDRMSYETSLMHRMDWEGALDYAREEGHSKAMVEIEAVKAEAKAQVIEAEARARRAESEAHQEKLELARSIKEMGVLTDAQLVEKFRLPIKVIQDL